MYVCRNPLELFYFWWLFRMVGEIPPLWIRIHCGIESSTRHLFTLQIYTGNLYTFCNSSAIKWLSTIVKGCPNDNDPLLMENICLPVIFWGMKSIYIQRIGDGLLGKLLLLTDCYLVFVSHCSTLSLQFSKGRHLVVVATAYKCFLSMWCIDGKLKLSGFHARMTCPGPKASVLFLPESKTNICQR